VPTVQASDLHTSDARSRNRDVSLAAVSEGSEKESSVNADDSFEFAGCGGLGDST
jgi:hypothetical protein